MGNAGSASDVGFCGGEAGGLHQGNWNTCGIYALSLALEQAFVPFGVDFDANASTVALQAQRLKNAQGYLVSQKGTTLPHLVKVINNRLEKDELCFTGRNKEEIGCKITVREFMEADDFFHSFGGQGVVLAWRSGTTLGHFMRIKSVKMVQEGGGKINVWDRPGGIKKSHSCKFECDNSNDTCPNVQVPGPEFNEIRRVFTISINDVWVSKGLGNSDKKVAAPKFKVQSLLDGADPIPPGWRFASAEEVRSNLTMVSPMLEMWGIYKLADWQRIDGRGHGSKIQALGNEEVTEAIITLG